MSARCCRALFALWIVAAAIVLPLDNIGAQTAPGDVSDNPDALPERLVDTGLYTGSGDGGSRRVRPELYSYTPQYPLWSDGATKRRWFYLPPGATIDAQQFDAWEFPPGTRFWKEFGHGRPIETRLIERLADGTWRYASYVWNADGSDARLAPADGIAKLPAEGAPGGTYEIPSVDDCRACHEGAAVPVLGVSALQLSPDRDPHAPNAEAAGTDDVDLRALLRLGLLRNVPAGSGEVAPRVAATSPTARAALGYLHANCGHCHNDRGPLADVGLVLAQESTGAASVEKLLRSTIGREADSAVEGRRIRIVAGRPDESQLVMRMKTQNPYNRMPPLGTRNADDEAIAVVDAWIRQLDTLEGNET